MQTPPVTSVSNFIPLVMGGAKKIGAEELIARLGHFIGTFYAYHSSNLPPTHA